jgi:type VI secretion system secreted protein Hcp
VGFGSRIGRPWRAVALLAVGAVGGGAALAVASVPDGNGVIHACVTTDAANGLPAPGPNVRIIDSAHQACNTLAGGPSPQEATLNWNVTGPPGPPGQNGQNGQNGTQGPPGTSGKTNTITAGNTITIGGTVITVGTPQTITIAATPFTGRNSATLTLIGDVSLTTDILGLSYGATAPGTHTGGGGGGSGKVKLHDIQITKDVDKSSVKLQLACASGKHIKEAIIVVRKAGGPQLEYDLHDVIVSSYALGSGHGNRPTESFTLNFSSIKIQYTKQK